MKKLLMLIVFGLVAVLGTGVLAVRGDAPVEGRVGRAEVRFLEGMIDHHQMALDMANDCLGKATTESVSTMCQDIIDAQSAEIEQMQGWLLSWYNIEYSPMAMTDMQHSMETDATEETHTDMDMPVSDPPMMMGMMAGLSRLEGTDYEVAFLEAMVDHHDDAIHMSQRILERDPEGTGHAELRTQAQKIIDDQTAEIEMMEQMLTEFGQ
jgi:uncharacterized protein (DUF305 family)